jgi:hypothetical protein
MPRSDSRLKNLPADTLDELWDLKYPADREQKALSLAEVRGVLRDQYKIEISMAPLCEFYQWLEIKRRMDARERLADQLKLAMAADKSISDDQIKRAGQRLFMSDGILEKDAKVFLAAVASTQDDAKLRHTEAKIGLAKEKVNIDKRKLAMLEAKAAKADQAGAITNDGALTEEEKAARIKQLFRMG